MSRRSAREVVLHLIFSHDFLNNDADELLENRLSGESFLHPCPMSTSSMNSFRQPRKSTMSRTLSGESSITRPSLTPISKNMLSAGMSAIFRALRARFCGCACMRRSILQIPVAASVNEALELVKKYDSDEAAAFVNGVLGAFIKKEVQK